LAHLPSAHKAVTDFCHRRILNSSKKLNCFSIIEADSKQQSERR
jgi:hypothetical protein